MKLLLQTPGFFLIPPKKIEVEPNPVAGRTYFISNGRIVAVASFEERQHEDQRDRD